MKPTQIKFNSQQAIVNWLSKLWKIGKSLITKDFSLSREQKDILCISWIIYTLKLFNYLLFKQLIS
jgi:hypothetical protein